MTAEHPVTPELQIWKVSVLCEGLKPAYPGKKKASGIERRYTTVLVNADGSDAAMAAGKHYADCNAGPDIKWECFTPLSASRVVLPLAVEDLR